MATVTVLLALVAEVFHALRARGHAHATTNRSEVGRARWVELAVPRVRMELVCCVRRRASLDRLFLVAVLVVLVHAAPRVSLPANHRQLRTNTLLEFRLVSRLQMMVCVGVRDSVVDWIVMGSLMM